MIKKFGGTVREDQKNIKPAKKECDGRKYSLDINCRHMGVAVFKF